MKNIEKIERLAEEGVGINIAIFLLWKELTEKDKEELTFDQCWDAFKIIKPGCLFEEKGLLEEIKKKADSPEELKKVLEVLVENNVNHHEKVVFWKKLIDSVKTFEGNFELLSKGCEFLEKALWEKTELLAETLMQKFLLWTISVGKEREAFWKKFLLEAKKSSFKDCRECWEELNEYCQKKKDFLPIVLSRAETFNQLKWAWERNPSEISQKNNLWEKLKAKTKCLNQAIWLWEIAVETERKEREAWSLLLKVAENESFEECLIFLNCLANHRGTFSEMGDIWDILFCKAESLDEYIELWRCAYFDTSKRKQAWDLVKEELVSFEECVKITHDLMTQEFSEWLCIARRTARSLKHKVFLWKEINPNSCYSDEVFGDLKKGVEKFLKTL